MSANTNNLVELTLPPSFPTGEYTPHGYIDNPHHSMVHNRSGMIRSVPPLGFGYWCRTFKGCYGTGPRRHVNYLSLLNLAIACADLRLVTADDFARHNIELLSRYHSKHMISYDFAWTTLRFTFQYFLPREHTLVCRVEIHNDGPEPRALHLHATHTYGLWEQRWWGADGLGARYLPDVDALVSTVSAYGDFFALGGDIPSCAHKATADTGELHRWLRENDLHACARATVRGSGPLYGMLSHELVVNPGQPTHALLALSRGTNEPAALHELDVGLREARPALAAQLDQDEQFWARCPQLDGDWPGHWKRGWVYDWETLRMNVRPPLGIFKHPWDAMQAHSPRSVLGEAAVDMFMLSYADPKLAQEVLFGTFADAPQVNVPCCREDGSMNMVAADGVACGTAPVWCFPFHVIRAIYVAQRDDAWIRELYPHLKSYLEWWLANRTDEHGWFRCHCDWESGQDGSKRFPESEGADADSVATVDVEASMAEALHNMAVFADIADRVEDKPGWVELASQKAKATRQMFVDGWFRDFDTRTGEPIILPDYVDIMMLAPLTCGVATPEQVDTIREKFEYFREHPKHWLEWPSFFLAYSEAAWTAGLRELIGEATADIADRIYPRIDQRGLRFHDSGQPYAYRVPGVSCEYWPLEEETEPGGENYGWGATLPLHIIRDLIGFREVDSAGLDPIVESTDVRFHVAPALPVRLMVADRSYSIRNLDFRGIPIALRYDVVDAGRLRVTMEFSAARAGLITITDQADQTVVNERFGEGVCEQEFTARNNEVLTVTIAT